MSVVTRNLFANVSGSLWAALMGLAFIPLLINFMGVEAYGLVGFFFTLQSVFSLLDLGLSTTLNREFARLMSDPEKLPDMRNLLRTVEVFYWAIGLVVAIVIILLARVIAYHWVHATQLPEATIERAIMIMGVVVGAQWPLSLYSGGLIGLQQQVMYNGVSAVAATARNAGAVLVLWLVSPTIVAYFVWQVVVSFGHTIAIAVVLWNRIRGEERPRFDWMLVRSLYRFAAGVLGITAMSILLTQMDKLILSKLLTLEAFGYYTVAGVAAASLYRLVSPVFTALFPRFSQLAASGDASLVPLYHRACQSMAALVVPIAVFTSFYSFELLQLWTHNPAMARAAAPILSLLVLGTAVNGLLNLPFGLQLAHGWTRLTFIGNMIAAAVLLPVLWFGTSRYGAIGAAAVWCIYNVGYAVIIVRIMHTRILPGEHWRWYLQDVGLPIVAATAAAALTRQFVGGVSTPLLVLQLILAGGFVQVVTCAVIPEIRRRVFT